MGADSRGHNVLPMRRVVKPSIGKRAPDSVKNKAQKSTAKKRADNRMTSRAKAFAAMGQGGIPVRQDRDKEGY